MPASPIRRLVPYAEAAKKRGVTVYHLNIGQPDIETPKQILDAVRHSDFRILEYSHSAGNESYRRKLVQYYERNGISINYTDIIVTTGGSEAILFGFMAALDAGDEVIITEPFYANYNGFAVEANVIVNPYVQLSNQVLRCLPSRILKRLSVREPVQLLSAIRITRPGICTQGKNWKS